MNKPKYEENIVSCPKCGQLDNVSLVTDTVAIFWCACGRVYQMEIENHSVYEYSHIATVGDDD